MSNRRLLQYEDLGRMEYLSHPAVSPDGRLIAYVIRTADPADGVIRPVIHLTDPQGSFRREIRAGLCDHTDSPAFSPDGRRLAFLSDLTGYTQVFCISTDPALIGSVLQLTDMRHGVQEYAWAPDGESLAVSAPLWEDDPLLTPQLNESERADFKWQQKHLPKYISELMYKFDSCYGIVDGSQTAICLVPFGSPDRIRRITRERFSWQAPVFSPDGNILYMKGYPHGHKDGLKSELYQCCDFDSDSPSVTQISDGLNYQGSTLSFCPGHEQLYYSYWENLSEGSLCRNVLAALSPDGKDFSCLFPGNLSCDGIEPLHVGITENGRKSPAYQASSDGRTFYFCSAWDGKAQIYALDLVTHAVRQVTYGNFSITEFSLISDSQMVVLLTTETHPLDLYLWDIPTALCRPILPHNQWMKEISLAVPLCITMNTSDPAMPVQGFVCPPVLLEAETSYPSFHYIHGGPEAYYAVGFDFEVQMMAARGLAVIYCNPRGSAGYGPAFARNQLSYDGTACQDLMNFTDHALKNFPWLDPARIGIGGGSYGGWMTNYILGQTDRFRAAVVQRTWSNPATSYGTGDLGFYSQNRQGALSFMEYMTNRARQAVLRTVDHYKTPCLILHGQKDFRCSLEQGEQVFSVMRNRVPEIPSRLVIYPGENHEISRKGKVHWQISHLREMIEWVLHYTSADTTGEDSNEL